MYKPEPVGFRVKVLIHDGTLQNGLFMKSLMFCVAVLFTDMPETFFLHIQNPQDQMVLAQLVLALSAFPGPTNRC
jgi:hypothetical protein